MSVISQTKWFPIFFLIVMSIMEGCDDEKKQWTIKVSTDHEVHSPQPVPGEWSRQIKSTQVQDHRASLSRSAQEVWLTSSSRPEKQESKRNGDVAEQNKDEGGTPKIKVYVAAPKAMAPLSPNDIVKDKGKVVRPHGEKKLLISIDDSSLAKLLEDEAVTQNATLVEPESGDKSQSIVSLEVKQQQGSLPASDLSTVQASVTNSLPTSDTALEEEATSKSNGEDMNRQHVRQDLVVSPTIGIIQISQTPFPGIETIAVPDTTPAIAVTEQQEVPLNKDHVVSVQNPARVASSSDRTKIPEEDSSKINDEKHSDEHLIEDNLKEKQRVSKSLLPLPPSNFMPSLQEHDAESSSEQSGSKQVQEIDLGEETREPMPRHPHDDGTDEQKMIQVEGAVRSGFEAKRSPIGSSLRQKTKRQSRVSDAEPPSLIPTTPDTCEKGRRRLVRQQYQATITSLSQSIRQYEKRDLSHDQRLRLRDCYRRRAYTFFQLGDFSRALSDMNYVLEEWKTGDEHRSSDFFFRGQVYTAVTNSQRALEDLSKALALGLNTHEQAFAYYLRGLSYLRLRRLQPGLQDLSKGCRAEHADACDLLEKIL